MLEVHCERCGRVLIGVRQVVGLTNTPDGIELAFVCGCGRPGGVLTGRARSSAQRPALAGVSGEQESGGRT
jgi:hypothetical protein